MFKKQDLEARKSGLSAEKRALLLKRLRGGGGNRPKLATITPRDRSQETPLSFSQERMWFLNQLEPDSPAYNEPEAVRFVGDLDLAALTSAFGEVVARHEVLRTSFTTIDGAWAQLVSEPEPVDLPLDDWSGLDSVEQETRVLALAKREAEAPFDLQIEKPWRVRAVRLSAQEHILFLTMHHIVCDGWSMAVFLRELGGLYAARVSGQTSPLPPLEVQYGDFATWQRKRLQGTQLEKLLDYWRGALDGIEPIELPTDHPRPAFTTFNGAKERFVLSAETASRINELCQVTGTTPYMLLLSIYQTLLQRYSRQNDIAVGSPIANRNRGEVEPLIGFFVNTLVMRANFDADPTFLELLAQVKQTALNAFKHQDVPFEMLVDALQPNRDLSRQPLFQTAFILQNMPPRELALPGVTLEKLEAHNDTSKFEITLCLEESAETNEYHAFIEYNTDLYNAETMQRLGTHFSMLLDSALAHPEQPVSKLKMLTAAERQQVLVDFNRSEGPIDRTPFPHMIEAVAEAYPDMPAIDTEAEVFTYAEMNRRANQLARHLQARGVTRNVIVGICTERIAERIIAVLAIMKAGGGYLPLDANYPRDRLRLMVEDAEPPVVVTQSHLATLYEGMNVEAVLVDDWSQFETISGDNLAHHVDPLDLAYTIYTSGSTGKPKGVLIPHHCMSNLVGGVRRVYGGVAPGERILRFCSFNFDVSVFDFITALTNAATLIIASDEHLLPGETTTNTLRRTRATYFFATPSALMNTPIGDLPDLHTVTVGGEACPLKLVRDWGTGRRFFNGYGPTEATVFASFKECHPDMEKMSIGDPTLNTKIYILDPAGNPTPVGVPGEMYIGGVQVTDGYNNRPKLNAERFVDNPFDEGRMYRTGDLATWLPNGEVDFIGRVDFQVKIRGYRIELGEIEARLRDHEDVMEAIVRTWEAPDGDKQLVGYVSSLADPQPSTADLRAYLGESLPAYMVPAHLIVMDTLPLSPNGKLDRKALPTPEAALRETKAYVAPKTETEQAIAQIWADALGIEQVGHDDDFFELGGHSLKTVQVTEALRRTFDVPIPVRAIFQNTVLCQLAAQIDRLIESPFADIDQERPDLIADSQLDVSIRPKTLTNPITLKSAENVLLTGGTGFLGAYILHALQRDTDATIHCLVRAGDEAAGMTRLSKNLDRYGMTLDESQVRVVLGDLAKPKLGLDDVQWEVISAEIDLIIHNGALINLTAPYSQLKQVNVDGTQEILRLACHGETKPLHYVSTLSVFESRAFWDEPVLHERLPLAHDDSIDGNYPQSKWAAERMVVRAQERGLPVAIFRPGRVSGSQQNGLWNTDDSVCRTLKGCIEMGIAPDEDMMVDLVPVDYCADALVAAAQNDTVYGQNYHLGNPNPQHWHDVIAWLNQRGYPLELVRYTDWYDAISSYPESAVYPLLAGLEYRSEAMQAKIDARPVQPRVPRFGFANILDQLATTSVACKPVDENLLKTYLDYFVASGFLPATTTPSSTTNEVYV